MKNSIPVCRSILAHWIYADAEYLKVWLTMLSTARYLNKPTTVVYEKASCTINRGEFIFGRRAWSKQTKVSEQRLRGLIKLLIKDNMLILKQQTNHFSVYLIANYAKFNPQITDKTTQEQPPGVLTGTRDSEELQPTDNQQGNPQITTNKEGQEPKKEKTDIIYTPEFEKWYSGYPRPQAKRDSFINFEKIRKSKGIEFIQRCTRNYIKQCHSLPRREKEYYFSSNNFFGQKGYYEEFEKDTQQKPNPNAMEITPEQQAVYAKKYVRRAPDGDS